MNFCTSLTRRSVLGETLMKGIEMNEILDKLVLLAYNNDCGMITRAHLLDSLVADRVPLTMSVLRFS